MVVCSFYQQGRCKFGGKLFLRTCNAPEIVADLESDRCRYEHPGRASTGASGNRFGALSGGFEGKLPVRLSKISLWATVERSVQSCGPLKTFLSPSNFSLGYCSHSFTLVQLLSSSRAYLETCVFYHSPRISSHWLPRCCRIRGMFRDLTKLFP